MVLVLVSLILHLCCSDYYHILFRFSGIDYDCCHFDDHDPNVFMSTAFDDDQCFMFPTSTPPVAQSPIPVAQSPAH